MRDDAPPKTVDTRSIAVNEPRSLAAAGEGQVPYMYDFASGPSAAVGLLGGSEPPLSPETVGRAPSFLEAPVALKPIPAVVSTITLPAPAPLPAPPTPIAAGESLPIALEAAPVEKTEARLVVRMLGGDELELGLFEDRDDAVEAAKELVARFGAAEATGDWPEMDGRFLRPASIASIDVLVAE